MVYPCADELTHYENIVITRLSGIIHTSSQCPGGLSTRDIAELCDMDIYKTRYFLLKLKHRGLVEKREYMNKKSLYWHLSRK